MVFYTDKLIPARFAGYTVGPIIFIRPKYRGDKALLAHEKVHVRQFWRTFGLFPILYLLWEEFRLAAEVEAYVRQLRCFGPRFKERYLPVYAEFISTKYKINITSQDAEEMLRRGL